MKSISVSCGLNLVIVYFYKKNRYEYFSKTCLSDWSYFNFSEKTIKRGENPSKRSPNLSNGPKRDGTNEGPLGPHRYIEKKEKEEQNVNCKHRVPVYPWLPFFPYLQLA